MDAPETGREPVIPTLLLAALLPGPGTSPTAPPVQETPAAEDEAQEPRHVRPQLPTPEELAELPADGGPRWNRLVFEKSPYLLQHAANPVDWWPWGPEAFEEARRLDKPIFLSVGYSTCHWCHVMEHESFENEEVAALLNESFVPIKVDREERPDVDHVYMEVTQGLTGRGGWPNTVFLTPDGEPFFAATYIPRESRFGRKGMLEMIPELGRLWKERKADIVSEAKRLAGLFAERADTARGASPVSHGTLKKGFEQLSQRYDPRHGGFGTAPKFPVPHNLLFLLQHHRRHGDAKALEMVETTLRQMRLGGVYDHVGFGFHRYSTDQEWFLPHFEKMLYDQALIAMACVGAWQVTGKDEYRRTAEEVFTYVLRDMTSPEGGFYSAEDADSEGEEGLFYLWTPAQVKAVLGEEEGALFCNVYGIVEGGNFREEATGESTGRNIPHLEAPLDELARGMELEPAELRRRLEASRQALFAVREERIHPLKDDKVLTDWNGLMIAALARAGAAFGDERYVAAARRAADFALAELRTDEGRLLKRWRAGEAGLTGTLEDHAFLAWGLLELYEACYEPAYLAAAIETTDTMLAHFWDPEGGGLYLSADDGEKLFLRAKEIYDGALPSGNSVAAWNLLRLARITGRDELEEKAAELFEAFGTPLASTPMAHTLALLAVDFAVGPSYEVVVAGSPGAEDTRALLDAVHARWATNRVLLLRPPGEAPPITRIAPFTEAQTERDGKAAAYFCENFACLAPTTDPAALAASLDGEERP